jgi:putative hemolysin
VLVILSRPLLQVVHWVNRPFEVKQIDSPRMATLEEITALAGLAHVSKEITRQQEQIVKAAIRLSRLTVRDVLIPADDVSFLSTSQSVTEALIAAHVDSHTRFPVCEGSDRNRVVGYLNFKELVYFMRTNPNDTSLRGVIRPLPETSPDATATDLLKSFVEEHIHVALVRDEAGKTLGMVTLEDLMEELVGDLQDEFDHLPHMLHPLTGGTWMAGGGLPIAELAQRLSWPLPDAQGSVSAWLCSRLGGRPKAGDVHREGQFEFTVRRIRRGKVFEASVCRLDAEKP